MSDPFVPRVGGILSADIAVPEHEREVRFYSRVLSTGENPLWREDLMNNRGMPIIGLGARSAEYADLPLQWMPHIQVADVAASVERALDLSGSELMHAKDDDGKSQWAVLLDPNGAAFGIIPVVSAEAFPPTEGVASRDAAAHVGCISWLDLTVSDASATRDFYLADPSRNPLEHQGLTEIQAASRIGLVTMKTTFPRLKAVETRDLPDDSGTCSAGGPSPQSICFLSTVGMS